LTAATAAVFISAVELRKDPITRSWVITGDEAGPEKLETAGCLYCSEQKRYQIISSLPGEMWSAAAVVHPSPMYRIEGDPRRQGDGLYDKMQPVGAHEVLLENAQHDRHLWQADDQEISTFLRLAAQRITDLKRDRRFKYVTVFKNQGAAAGQELEHPHSQLTATTYVPRRVLYELRSGREHYMRKERCVFCDMMQQELDQETRIVEANAEWVASCPYAARVPYETWIMPREHEASFERSVLARPVNVRGLAVALRRCLQRVRSVTPDFHMVLHTTPNTQLRSDALGYWKTIDEDYHWHIEILPIIGSRAKSYTLKETYFTPVSPERAAAKLREAVISG
jgi:UDPglucose--hexose-1-phosphate uridylyltransferase